VREAFASWREHRLPTLPRLRLFAAPFRSTSARSGVTRVDSEPVRFELDQQRRLDFARDARGVTLCATWPELHSDGVAIVPGPAEGPIDLGWLDVLARHGLCTIRAPGSDAVDAALRVRFVLDASEISWSSGETMLAAGRVDQGLYSGEQLGSARRGPVALVAVSAAPLSSGES
jgi:hypothetical protein